MLVLNLKYQIRQGLFLMPMLLVPLYFITSTWMAIFLLLQLRFYKVFEQNDFQLRLLHVIGANLPKLLLSYNLSWAIWFNGWFGLAQLVTLFKPLETHSFIWVEIINYNSILFLSFWIGNILSNSDLITIKNSILRFLTFSFIFGMSISITFSFLRLIEWLQLSPLINGVLLLGIIIGWYYHIKKQHRVNFIQYYL